MSATDSVSVFAEGTFEEQVRLIIFRKVKLYIKILKIQELVNYIIRTRPEEERIAFIHPFQDAMKTGEGQKPMEEDQERKKKVFAMVLSEVKGLGDGNEKGMWIIYLFRLEIPRFLVEIEGFFNLVYAHLFTLFPSDTPGAKQHPDALLQTISSAPSEQSSIKYRM